MGFNGPVAPNNIAVLETLKLYIDTREELAETFEIIQILMYLDIQKMNEDQKAPEAEETPNK